MSGRRALGASAPARVRRAVTFAATSAGLSWFAHAAAGGSLPNFWLLMLGAVALVGLAYPLVGRECGSAVIVLGLVGAQALMHGWLVISAGGHAHDHGGGVAGTMLLAHAVATAVAALWLRHGERAVWRRARRAWIAAVLDRRQWLPVPAIHVAAEVPATRCAVTPQQPQALVAAFGVRGPPLPVGP